MLMTPALRKMDIERASALVRYNVVIQDGDREDDQAGEFEQAVTTLKQVIPRLFVAVRLIEDGHIPNVDEDLYQIGDLKVLLVKFHQYQPAIDAWRNDDTLNWSEDFSDERESAFFLPSRASTAEDLLSTLLHDNNPTYVLAVEGNLALRPTPTFPLYDDLVTKVALVMEKVNALHIQSPHLCAAPPIIARTLDAYNTICPYYGLNWFIPKDLLDRFGDTAAGVLFRAQMRTIRDAGDEDGFWTDLGDRYGEDKVYHLHYTPYETANLGGTQPVVWEWKGQTYYVIANPIGVRMATTTAIGITPTITPWAFRLTPEDPEAKYTMDWICPDYEIPYHQGHTSLVNAHLFMLDHLLALHLP